MSNDSLSEETEKWLQHVELVYDNDSDNDNDNDYDNDNDKTKAEIRYTCICPSCHSTPLVCAQSLSCGHNLCFGCLQRVEECPLCKEPATRVCTNLAVRGLSLNMEATCEFGCTFPNKVTVYDVLTHLKTTCQMVEVQCPNAGCSDKVSRARFKDHKDSCVFGLDHRCRCGVQLTRREMANHINNDCPKGEIMCHLGCGAKLCRSDVFGHQTTCERGMVTCKVPGCTEVVRRCDLQNHLKTSMEGHARLASSLSKRLERQLMSVDWVGEIRPVTLAVQGQQVLSYRWDLHPFKAKLLKGVERFYSTVFSVCEGRWRLVLEKREAWLLSLQLVTRVDPVLMRFKFVLPNSGVECDSEHMYFPRQGILFREGSANGGPIKMSQEDLESFVTKWWVSGNRELWDCLRIQLFMQEVDTVHV